MTLLVNLTSSSSTPTLSLFHRHRSLRPHYFSTTFPNPNNYIQNGKTGCPPQTLIRGSSDNQTVAIASPTTKDDGNDESPLVDIDSASEIVRKFYAGINGNDLASVENLIAEDCVYEDLIFPRPFIGRMAILEFFKKFIDSISTDLQFVIDDISNEDSSAVGVTWHLEWKGKPFPFSKGCSFYRLKVMNGKKQIIYGRDSVEPSIKPGETALVAIRGVTWLLQQFPQLADQL